MDIWHIRGGNKLEGTCFVQGSKNASLPIIAASIAAPARSELTNVPQLRDVDAALRILRHLGCTAEQLGNDVYIDSAPLTESTIPHSLMLEMRSSVIFMGALLARCGVARLSLPGGCPIGARPVDYHLLAFRALGAEGTVLILGCTSPQRAGELARLGLTQTVADLAHAEALNAQGVPLRVHLTQFTSCWLSNLSLIHI